MERFPLEFITIVSRLAGRRGPGGRDPGSRRAVRARAQAHPLSMQPLLQGTL